MPWDGTFVIDWTAPDEAAVSEAAPVASGLLRPADFGSDGVGKGGREKPCGPLDAGAEAVGNDKPDPLLLLPLAAGCEGWPIEGSERDEPGANELKEDMMGVVIVLKYDSYERVDSR
jgi:hypothetical protein